MNLAKLEAHEIFNIINVKGMNQDTKLHFKDDARFRYLHFHLQGCEERKSTLKTAADIISFFEPMHSFIDEGLAKGQNVMVHCLAGAHRAGTAGVSYMMYAAQLSYKEARAVARKQRPNVDPYDYFEVMLIKLEHAYRELGYP